MISRWWLTLMFCSLACISCQQQVRAQDNRYPQLHIFLLTDQMPAPGAPEGYMAQEVRKTMASYQQLRFQIHYVSWPKALAEVARRPDALVPGLLRTPSREAHFSWLVPAGPAVPLYLYTLAGQPLRQQSLQQLRANAGLRIACPAESAHCEMLSHAGFSAAQIVPVRLSEQSSVERLLLAKRVDFIAAAGADVQRRMALLGVPATDYVQAQQVAELRGYLAGGLGLNPAVKALMTGQAPPPVSRR